MEATQLNSTVEEAAQKLWTLSQHQQDILSNKEPPSGPVDAQSDRISEINQRLQSHFFALSEHQEQLKNENAALEASTFHPKRRKWIAFMTTGIAFSCWMMMISGAIWTWKAGGKDENPVRFDLVVKIVTIAITALMWAAWDRWTTAEAKLAEFRQGYEDQLQRARVPADMMAKLQEYEELIGDTNTSEIYLEGEEGLTVMPSTVDPEQAAHLIKDILHLYDVLPPRFKSRFPTRDMLLATLIYMLPPSNELRESYEGLHAEGLKALKHLSAPEQRKARLNHKKSSSSDSEEGANDFIETRRFEASTIPLYSQMAGGGFLHNNSYEDAEREHKYRKFQERFGIKCEATYRGGIESRRCGLVRPNSRLGRYGCDEAPQSEEESYTTESLEDVV